MLSLENTWQVIVVVAVFTYLARCLPFLLSRKSKVFQRIAEPDSVLAALGPCLLIAITSATLFPAVSEDLLAGGKQIVPTVLGLAGTLGVMKVWADVGLAVIVGMVCYTLGALLFMI
jgi:branched-subunit amino acid transport protein